MTEKTHGANAGALPTSPSSRASMIAGSVLLAGIALACGYAWSEMTTIVGTTAELGGGLSTLFSSIALYLLASTLVGCIWYVLVREERSDPGVVTAVLIVWTAQFGKYVPGNVAQFVGRIALARRYGFNTGRGAAALAIENILGLLSAGGVAAVAMLVSGQEMSIGGGTNGLVKVGVGATLAVMAVGGIWLVRRSRWEEFKGPHVLPSGTAMGVGFCLFVVVQCLVGLALYQLVRDVSVARDVGFWWILGSVVVASVAGLVTPGAPGGLGVREAVLTLGLAPVMGSKTALMIALSFRFVTIVGDFVGFVWGGLGLSLWKRSFRTA